MISHLFYYSNYFSTVEEYQELTSREEEDLKLLLSSRPDAFKDAEEFTERLSEELASLDAVSNVGSL